MKQGDTLSRIAKLRNGLRVADLAWLNNIRDVNSLRVGQRLMVPNQAYLDAGRRARANLLNLAFYVDTHGGRMPPDATKVPSIEEQLNSNWRSQVISGYTFRSDVISRPRRISGRLTHSLAERRSRRLQTRAGGADRRATDDGGHYIARRFNGPRHALNHFAQNRSFNRGSYRILEDTWARHLRAGRSVFVDIIPRYEGTSLRPSSIVVLWHVDGERYRDEFPNEKREASGGK